MTSEVIESEGAERTVRLTVTNYGPAEAYVGDYADADWQIWLEFQIYGAITLLSTSVPCADNENVTVEDGGTDRKCGIGKSLAVGDSRSVDVRVRVDEGCGWFSGAVSMSAAYCDYQCRSATEDPNYANQSTDVNFKDDPGPPPVNRPPIAQNDHWRLPAGHYVYDNALKNDSDPDGDRFTPRVTSISFRAGEWSGMEQDGTFNYVSGPGTRVKQRKVITYHLVDSKGARSAPATVTIDVIPPGKARGRSPRGKRRGRRASAAAGARWYYHANVIYSCFGRGFDKHCFGVYSPRQVQAVNAATPWGSLPTSQEARRACALAFSRAGVAGCAGKLLAGGLLRAGDKQIIRTAASGGGYCLIFHQELNRTPLHPLAGRWTKPSFSQVHSFLKIGTLGTWSKSLTKTWRVPVGCTANAAAAQFPVNLVVR